MSARAAHNAPMKSLPGCVGFGFSRDLIVVSCILHPTWFLWRHVVHIVLIVVGTKSACGHTLSVNRLKIRLGPYTGLSSSFIVMLTVIDVNKFLSL